jgi:MFS transporter, AAHS family, 4-hydroxybenzoate transporter
MTDMIFLWTPAVLHSGGVRPSLAIIGTTAYSLGVITGPLLTPPFIDRIGLERVMGWQLSLGALCIVSIGILDPPFWLLWLLLCGAEFGGGCQAGINVLSSVVYPIRIRAIGAGRALGAGRIGSIAGRFLGGLLLELDFRPRNILVAAAVPACAAAALMVGLGRARRGR